MMVRSPKVRYDEELGRIMRSGDPLSKMHREIVGASVRIHIPLVDVISLRNVGFHLRRLAQELDVLSRSTEETWVALNVAKTRIKACDAVIRAEVKLSKGE